MIDYSGQSHEKAAYTKIIGNIFIINIIETLAEAHTLAEKTDLGHENLHKFVQTLFPGAFEIYSTRMINGDYYTRERVRAEPSVFLLRIRAEL